MDSDGDAATFGSPIFPEDRPPCVVNCEFEWFNWGEMRFLEADNAEVLMLSKNLKVLHFAGWIYRVHVDGCDA